MVAIADSKPSLNWDFVYERIVIILLRAKVSPTRMQERADELGISFEEVCAAVVTGEVQELVENFLAAEQAPTQGKAGTRAA